MQKKIRKILGWVVLAGLCATVPTKADYAIYAIFAIDDEDSEVLFSEAMDLAGAVSIGMETFATSTLGLDGYDALQGSLLFPGEPNGPYFPQGTDRDLGIHIQTNSLGGAPVGLSPGGPLFASGATYTGFGSIGIGADDSSDSLDLIIDPLAFRGLVRGLSFDVLGEEGNPVEVRLFDNYNNLLSSSTLLGGSGGQLAVAVAAGPDSTIFRLNLWAPNGYADVGNIEVYAIPEPAAGAAIFGIVVLLLLWFRRR